MIWYVVPAYVRESTMGREKDRQEMAEEGWKAKAQSKGWTCKDCGCIPPLSERKVYFDTGLCGYCLHVREKLDKE